MASAQFSVNGTVPTTPVAVAPGDMVALALTNTAGVDGPRSIAWSIYGTHHHSATLPTLTPTGSPPGVTATLVMPNQADQAFGIECLVAGGKDASGRNDANLRARAIIGCVNVNGYLPFIAGEELERQATHGWTELLNELLRMTGGGGTGDGMVVYSAVATSTADSTLTLELQDTDDSSDHEPGVYLLSASVIVQTAATNGTVKAIVDVDDGEVEAWAPQTIASTGQLTFMAQCVHTSADDPMQMRFEFSGVTGSPSIDIRAIAIRVLVDPVD